MHRNKYFIRFAAMLMSCAAFLTVFSGCMEKADDDWKSADELRAQLYHASLDTDNEIDLGDNGDADMVLPYSADETINPYTCKSTLTQNICYLLYDSMIVLNPDFDVEYVIAKSITIDHTIVKVQIRSGIVFSDGSPLTAEDISYSYYMAAKTKGSIYKDKLSNVTNCSVSGMTVTFMMKEENINAYRMLDFPIIHYNPSANKELPPTGSGRYKFATLSDGITPNTALLVKNDKWYNPDKVKIEKISLREMPSVESIVHSIEIGTVSYMYSDMRDGTPQNVNADYQTVDINNLVYMGVNTNDTALADENVRRAIYYAISTNDVASVGFSGMALGATGPFTPNWSEAAKYQSGNGRAKKNAAIECLEQSGYVIINNGIREDQSGKQLSFNMLVNRGNSRHLAVAENIRSQLSEVGINVEITEISAEGLINRADKGQYHLYIAEYSILNDMYIGDLFTPGKGLYNGPKPYDCIKSYSSYIRETGELGDFITAFESELPFIPLCYRMGIIVYTRSLNGVGKVSENQPFYNMQNWYVNQTD